MKVTFLATLIWMQSLKQIVALRTDFYEGYENEAIVERVVAKLSEKEMTPLETGYFGAFKMMQAYLHWNPVMKLSFFEEGKKYIEKSIELDSTNAELRYLRFTNQMGIPEIMGYSKDIENDKAFILKSYHAMDEDLKKRVMDYMKDCEILTIEERKIFENDRSGSIGK